MSMEDEASRYLARKAQERIDRGEHKKFSSPERASEHAGETNFLGKLKEDLGLETIYYPGCSADITLEPAFQKRQITFLDIGILRHDAPIAYIGDFTDPPEEIIDASFDAVFIRDLHLHLQDEGELPPSEKLGAILKKVKPKGVIIYGIRSDCPKWEKELGFLNKRPELSPFSLSYTHENFHLFSVNRH